MPTPKLVRDKIPEIVAARGKHMKTEPLTVEAQRLFALDRKLLEEVWELMSADEGESMAEEIGDILTVLHAYAEVLGLDWYEDVMVPMSNKADERGEFKAFLIWDGNEPS